MIYGSESCQILNLSSHGGVISLNMQTFHFSSSDYGLMLLC